MGISRKIKLRTETVTVEEMNSQTNASAEASRER
jgi:hypothetical protein